MASRYFSQFPERKLPDMTAPPTGAPKVSKASKKGGNGMGAYNPKGRGHGIEGVEALRPAIKERTANWPKPGPMGKGYDTAGANIVKTRPAKHGIQ